MSTATQPRYRLEIGPHLHDVRMVDLETGSEVVIWAYTVTQDGRNDWPGLPVVTLTFPPGYVEIREAKTGPGAKDS